MAESLRGGLSLGLSGFGFWSHDIGGFEGLPPAEVYKRWVAFGLLSSHSRLHGSSSYRVPWRYDEEACDVLRLFTKLKCRLMPYLYAKAVEAHKTGLPVMRAMALQFPDDPACDHIDRQYMLGDALLVAPVLSADGVVEYYAPSGRWTHYLTGDTLDGPRWVRETHGFRSIPLLVRPNTLLAVGARDDRPDYAFVEGVTLRLYELADGAEAACTVPTPEGEAALSVTVRRTGRAIQASWTGAPTGWRLQLVGIASVRSADGAEVEADAEGPILRPMPGATSFSVEI
jgi:alpha-D-xyloside xylohydrolase